MIEAMMILVRKRAMRHAAPLLLALALPAGAPAPVEGDGFLQGPAGAPASAFPKPQRPVAPIVSDQWSNEDAREQVDEARRVMQLMRIGPGMSVADIGAGNGYYTVRLSPAVGPTGRVFAQDVEPEYLARLRDRITARRLPNVTLVLGAAHDPRLPRAAIDAALLVHMYHEIAQPYGLLWNLRASLKPGARVGIVDSDRPIRRHGTPPALLECEMAAAGYRRLAFHMLGASGYLAIFEPWGPPPPPARMRRCTG